MIVAVTVPIMIQMGITNFVSLLDNIMVGALGTESISGVSIVNQFIFVFNLLIFGAVSAAGIFTAQYYGSKDTEGVRATFRLKLLINVASGIIGVLLFVFGGDLMINLFLHDDGSGADLALAFVEAKNYLTYIIIGIIPYAISQVYASTLRETGETVVPMVSSIAAVAVNFALNLILIFGLLGAPALGVMGAAIATSVSRFVELFILIIWTHTHSDRCPFIKGALRSMRVPKSLIWQITVKGMPIMLNEFLWSCAITFRNQCYSTRGIDALAATSIATTVLNLFSVVYLSLGSAIAIVVGNKLGAGEIEEAKDTDRKMIAFSVAVSVVIGVMLALVSPMLPRMFDVGEGVQSMAMHLLIIQALYMPVAAFANSSYYTIRSGGRVMITMLLDSVFMWTFTVPISACLTYFTGMNVYVLYLLCQGTEIAKVILGAILLKKSNWARRLIDNEPEEKISDKND